MQVAGGVYNQPMLSTPNRFGRTSQGSYWNSGNGSPDAVCFSVDRPGVVIAGVGVYGGGGSYECDVELLDDVVISTLSFTRLSCVIVITELVVRTYVHHK